MGVEGLASARPVASPRDHTAAATKRHSLGASSVSSASADLIPDSPRALAELTRRRTSIPPDFTYGTEDADAEDVDAAAAAASERRWRSFDVAAVSAIGSISSASSSASAARLATLASRIERERAQLSAAEHAARPSRSRRRALFTSFLSPSRKEQIELRRMEMVARVAACNRSLVVLRDTLTTLALAEQADDANDFHHEANDVDVHKLADADAVLAEDCVHHVLALQLRFLRESAALHGDKALAPPRGSGSLSPSLALQQFLSEFTGAGGVPCALDAPTRALVRFEKLLARHKVLKPALKRSLDALCRDTLASFTRDKPAAPSAAQIWTTRAPQDVLPSLVRELEDSVLETAPVTESARGVLRVFLEQMVFTRLAGACYRSLAVELDEQSAQWREQVANARALQLDEVGLPVELPAMATDGTTPVLRQSIDAFNALPHLVPSSVLGAFLRAVRVLYGEANALLGLPSGCISADVLLPLLVFVLSRSELPHLHAQVFLMEQFAIDASQEGSEAAYYLACLQAAMGYIMTEVGKPTSASASCPSS